MLKRPSLFLSSFVVPTLLHRRNFIAEAGLTIAAVSMGRLTFAQAPSTSITVDVNASGREIPPDFVGLSYENMQLEDPAFFSPSNRALIEQFKAISPRGVLRLGGNTSEFSWWQSEPNQPPPIRSVVLKSGLRPQNTLYAITPHTIQELDGFLKATGWTCIYGLNLGFGTPESDLGEARNVFETLGPRLAYFQIGNEVDQFGSYHLREPATWNCDVYLEQWLKIARAVQKAIPAARFGLPDVASRVDWLTRIATLWPSVEDKPRLTTLSHHHYWSGPPSNPEATVERLLQPDPAVARKGAIARSAATSLGIAYRMTEGNTVYRGGKSGLSDVFASALWAAGYLLELMSLGYSGVNLHGGSGHAQAVSVGGSFVGEAEMKDSNQPHPKPFYTPIANEGTLAGSGVNGELNGKYVLEPPGYGMMFVAPFAGATMLPVNFQPGSVNAVAYAARRKDGRVILVVLNKDESQSLRLYLPDYRVHEVLWAPALTAKEAHLASGAEATALVKSAKGETVVPKSTGVAFLLS